MGNVISCFLPGTEFDRAAQGLLGAAARLASACQVPHVALAACVSDTMTEALERHADRVVCIRSGLLSNDHPESCLAAFHAACASLDAQTVLLGQDARSQEMTPRLGYRLGGCSIGDAQSIDMTDGGLSVRRSVYGGKAVAVVRASRTPAVVWIRARAFEPAAERSDSVQTEILDVEISDGIAATQVTGRQEESRTGVRLEDAPVIVSGGRGLGGPEPFEELKKLAGVMKAEVAASRAACDAGWVPPGLQVGQTGKKVAPELYLAIAISGASQHLMGITDARVIAAINTDAEAPIFRHCQFGLVDDWKNVVGPLTERIASLLQ